MLEAHSSSQGIPPDGIKLVTALASYTAKKKAPPPPKKKPFPLAFLPCHTFAVSLSSDLPFSRDQSPFSLLLVISLSFLLLLLLLLLILLHFTFVSDSLSKTF